MTRISVRVLGTVLLLLAFAMAVPQNCRADAAAQAKQTLEQAVDKILNIIREPGYANPATRGPLRQQIEDEVFRVFDFAEFSSRTVGPRWRAFSAAQKKNFENAFAQLLLNTYLNKVTGYNGETVTYNRLITSPEGNKVEVRTSIKMKDGKETPVFYRMLRKNGKWVVYDVIIENISLVKNYRTQFHDILNSASPEQLTERVRARAQEVAAHPEKTK